VAPVAPYSGPWLGPDDKGKIQYRGPAAVAFKRTISRGWNDLIPWRFFNEQFNSVLDEAVRKIQWQHGLQVTGNIGPKMFGILRRRRVPAGKPNAGEWAMDAVSVRLLEEAYDLKFPPKPPPLEVIRDALSEFLLGIEGFRGRWDYSQARPYSSLGRDPEDGGVGDCSSTVMLAYFWARSETGIHVPDPSGFGYSGFGNSQSIWERHRDSRKATAPFQVGDCALYGPSSSRTSHITVCRKPGDASSAIFTSHGSGSGPLPTRRDYRGDLLGVVRPPLLPLDI
jgi:Putative peptidoglycan binding domain